MGNAGNVIIDAPESIEAGGIIAATTFVVGNGGKVSVNTSRLVLREGGRVSASTFGSGDAGLVEIDATESIEVSGTLPGTTDPSQINSSAQLAPPIFQRLGAPPTPSGDAGGVTINTPLLRVSDLGQVAVGNLGSGNAGELQLNADTIVLDTEGQITAATQSGEGGNIELNVRDSLQLRHGSAILAEAGGTGNGGNVTLDTETIALLENSRITANAFEGAGGNIHITTSGIFLSSDSQISASSQFGVDGTVAVNNPIDDRASGLVTLSTDPLNPNTQIQDSCEIATRSRFAITGNGGLPPDPTQTLQLPTVWRDTRLGEIQSHLTPNPTGREPEESSVSTAPLIEATGWRTNDRGQVELIAASPNPSGSPWQPHPDCNSATETTPHRGSFDRK